MSLWKLLTARWGSAAGEVDDVRMDASTNSLQVVDYAHHEIHGGSLFEFTDYDADLDAAQTMEYIIRTPNTAEWAHFFLAVDGALQTLVELYEDTTHTVGAAQRVINTNRNVADNNTTDVFASNDDNADGTLIFENLFGIDAGVGINSISGGGQVRAAHEYILKQDTDYLLKITSNTANNVVSIKLRWYEHTNKNT